MVLSNKPVFVMERPGNLVRMRYYKGGKMLDEVIHFLDMYLENADSEETVERCRSSLADLIVGSCNSKPALQQSLCISDEELASIADSIPKSLVEKFVAHLKSAREHASSCLTG